MSENNLASINKAAAAMQANLLDKLNSPLFSQKPLIPKSLQIPEMQKIQAPESLQMPKIDSRSRAERRQDLEKALSLVNEKEVDSLIEVCRNIRNDDLDKILNSNEVPERFENALLKFKNMHNDFIRLNSEEDRKLSYKQNELDLVASHDWKEKFRLFFFRILASAVFIASLFIIGYLDHEYEWAHLPMAKYFNSNNVGIETPLNPKVIKTK